MVIYGGQQRRTFAANRGNLLVSEELGHRVANSPPVCDTTGGSQTAAVTPDACQPKNGTGDLSSWTNHPWEDGSWSVTITGWRVPLDWI